VNLGSIVKGGLGVLATAGATAVNPALGAVVGSALGGGAATKALGKRVEQRTGRRLHKVGSPVAAAAVPAALVGGGVIDPTALCETVSNLCESPALLTAGLGALATWGHSVVGGAGKVASKR